MGAPDRSAAIQAYAHSAAVTPRTRSVRAGGWRACGVRQAALPIRSGCGQVGQECAHDSDDWVLIKTVKDPRSRFRTDQAPPVRRTARGAKHRAAGTGLQPVPWSASEARRRQGWKPTGRDAIGGSMRSTTARPGIAGGRTAIRQTCNASLFKTSKTRNRLHAFAKNHRTVHS